MSDSIPIGVVGGWITDLQSILKAEIREARTGADFKLNQGMQHGLDQIRSRLATWRRHQKYLQTLHRLGRTFLMVRRVNLSAGRYRKLEWYQNNHFVTLAWRHGKNEETGELMLEIQHVQDLSTIYLIYQGSSSFDELVGLARMGGLEAVRNEENRGEWVKTI